MPTFFDCLFFLDNTSLCIVEVKWERSVQWLLIDKGNLHIQPLTFKSMDTSDLVEERFFDLGYLKFDPVQGIFIEKFNSAQHHLANKSKEDLPAQFKQAIAEFLENNNDELV